MMKTPICDFVNKYVQSGAARLHMPGHKGVSFFGIEPWDITEFEGADVLYHASGIIKESQENAAALFGTAKTFYATEGCSLAIRGMLYLVKLYAGHFGKKPIIAAGRNAHKTFVTAAGLLDLDVGWIFPETADTVVSCEVTPGRLDAFLKEQPEKPVAVYITSPDYLGNMADIKGLSAVCRNHGVLLLVDNAHGAYLRFLSPSCHPIDLGADVCCDSAHKTLPVLTGGAYLHIAKTAPAFLGQQGENALSLFASTSPSYLILQSLDAANRYMAEGYREKLAGFIPKAEELKTKLIAMGYDLAGDEPLKVTVASKSYGYAGDQLAEILLAQNMVCEFHDPDYLVMMLTPESGEETLRKIETAFSAIPQKPAITVKMPVFLPPKKAMSLHRAMALPGTETPVAQCVGRVLTQPTVSCPPAVPPVVCGEVIDQTAVSVMEYYGTKSCIVTQKRD